MFLCIVGCILGFFIFLYVYNKLTCGLCKSDTCLVGKTALITGGNAGIGFQVAKMLAARGCRIIIADVENCDESKKRIIETTNNPNIVTKYLNLASFKSVRIFAEDIIKTEEKLDILINNAGVGSALLNKTEDGLNTLTQINYFSPVLLTHLLIGLLKKSAPSRIIFTSSGLCFLNNLTLENIVDGLPVDKTLIPINSLTNYGNSKLATIITSNEIARRLEGTKVTCNSLHPGLAKTFIFKTAYDKNYNIFVNLVRLFSSIAAKNVWEASQTTLHLATAEELQHITGKFFLDCKPIFLPKKAYDEEFCKILFKKTEEIIGLSDTEKLKPN